MFQNQQKFIPTPEFLQQLGLPENASDVRISITINQTVVDYKIPAGSVVKEAQLVQPSPEPAPERLRPPVVVSTDKTDPPAQDGEAAESE